MALDKMGDILMEEAVPGSKDHVEILKVQGTLASSIMGAAVRMGDRDLTKRLDNKLDAILDQMKEKQKAFGVTLVPYDRPREGDTLSLEREASLAAPEDDTRVSPGGLLASAQVQELSQTLQRVRRREDDPD